MIKALTLICIITAIPLLGGCGVLANKSTITEFDQNGAITKRIETTESVISDIVKSTTNKTVVAWDNSWIGYVGVSTSTLEDPTPTMKAFVGKADKGVLTLHKDHDITAAPGIIEAARAGEISVSASGISSETPKTATETQNEQSVSIDTATDRVLQDAAVSVDSSAQ